jgi:hypothetical protein
MTSPGETQILRKAQFSQHIAPLIDRGALVEWWEVVNRMEGVASMRTNFLR